MLIHSFSTASKRDAAAETLKDQWPKMLKVNLATGEDLRIKDFAADGSATNRDPIAFPDANRFLVVASKA